MLRLLVHLCQAVCCPHTCWQGQQKLQAATMCMKAKDAGMPKAGIDQSTLNVDLAPRVALDNAPCNCEAITASFR